MIQYFLNKHVSFGTGYTDAAEVVQPTEVQSNILNLASNFLGATKVKNDLFGVTVPVYEFTNVSTNQQRTNETTGDTEQAEALDHMRSLLNDRNQNLTMTVKGDPWWMGNPDAYTLGRENNTETSKKYDTLIMVINFLPDESLADADKQYKPILDISVSGVYYVHQVTTRFQGGKFIQQLEASKKDDLTVALVQQAFLGLQS